MYKFTEAASAKISRLFSIAKALTKKMSLAYGGLFFLWAISIQPAPSDVLFSLAWLKRLRLGSISRILKHPALYPLLIFLAWSFISLVAAKVSLGHALSFLLATTYVIFLCFYFADGIRDRQSWEKSRYYYLAATIIAGIVIVGSGLAYILGLVDASFPLLRAFRPTGFFKDPNVAGPFVSGGLLFMLSRLIFEDHKFRATKRFIFLSLVYFFLLLAMIFTFSRSAMLGFFVALSVMGIGALWSKRIVRFLAFTLATIVFIRFMLPITMPKFDQIGRFVEPLGFLGPAVYDYQRIEIWKAGIATFLQQPFWGIGAGGFEELLPRSPHSTYIRVLAENGIPGLILFLTAILLIVMVMARSAKKALMRNYDLFFDAIWLLSFFSGMLAQSAVIDSLHWRHLWIIGGFGLAYSGLFSEHKTATRPVMTRKRLRILYLITKSEIGGAQTHVAQLARFMTGKDSEVAVMGFPGGWLEPEVQKLGVKFYPNIFFNNRINPLNLIRAAKITSEAIRDFSPDVVHCHGSFAGFVGRLIIRNTIPTIFTAHGWGFANGASLRRKILTIPTEAFAAKLCSKIVCVSSSDKELALRYRIASPQKIAVIHNGVEELFHRGTEPAFAPTDPHPIHIAFVGRLADPKNPLLLLQAFNELKEDVKGRAEITIIGSGPKERAVKNFIHAAGLEQKVKMLGSIPREQVFDILSQSNILALITNHEGFPYAILEAMHCGLAVLASDVGGIKEAITPECGILVPRKDKRAISAALEKLILNPELVRKMGDEGRKRTKELFPLRTMCEKMYALYHTELRDRAS